MCVMCAIEVEESKRKKTGLVLSQLVVGEAECRV